MFIFLVWDKENYFIDNSYLNLNNNNFGHAYSFKNGTKNFKGNLSFGE